MTLLNKKYCSHCGTPNPRENHTCAKCGKPISSALRSTAQDDSDEEVVIVKKKKPAKAVRYVYEGDDEEFVGELATPSSSDISIQVPPKLTVGSLKNGAQIPNFGQPEALPSDIEVTSRSYFHQEKLD
jgi:ribosomal protein L40E